MDIDSLFARADQIVSKAPGLVLSIAVVDRDGRERAACLGTEGDALLPSCSAFKPLVAAAVRSAAIDGVVDLHAPIRDLPGGDVVPDGWGGSLEAVMSHGSGLGGDLYEIPVTASTDGAATAELLERYLARVPRTDPGRFWYSNLGYALAGHVLAAAEQDDLLTIVRRRILVLAGAEVSTRRDAAPVPADRMPATNDSLRAAGGGVLLRAIDLARAGAFLAGEPGRAPGLVRTEPVRRIAAAGQHPAGGFFLDARYGRPLLVHGGGHGQYGASWIVDPIDRWSCAALFNHPAGYGLDLAGVALGRARGGDPLRQRQVPRPGWYLNEYAGVVEVTPGSTTVNAEPLAGACVGDGDGVSVNQTSIVIGSLPYRPAAAPDGGRANPRFAGRFAGEVDVFAIELGEPVVVRSAVRGPASAVTMSASMLACAHGTIELDGDDLLVGGAYRFTRS